LALAVGHRACAAGTGISNALMMQHVVMYKPMSVTMSAPDRPGLEFVFTAQRETIS
jgi:hypothetical protein